MRYIWIDALCITQDSSEDWEAEAPTMRDVYANSACNVCASTSDSPDGGLFRERDPKAIYPGLVFGSLYSTEPQPYYTFDKSYWDRQIFDGPLHNRGWVFQERLLAPRVLYFGKNQVLWECLTDHKCEGFPKGIPLHSSQKDLGPLWDSLSTSKDQSFRMRGLLNLWGGLIQQFSQCTLTKPSDKLSAMAGVAKLFQDVTGDEYVAGWWKSRLIETTDWRVHEPRMRGSSEYRAPSWSWASVDGPVSIYGVSARTEFLVVLRDVHVTSRGRDAMTSILDASIVLRGTIFMATCHYPDDGNRTLFVDDRQFTFRLYPDASDIVFPQNKWIALMPLKRDYSYGENGAKEPYVVCLILEKLTDTSAVQVRYRRLGHCTFYKLEEVDYFSAGSQVGNIKII